MTTFLSNTDRVEMFTLNSVNLGLQYKAKSFQEKRKVEATGGDWSCIA